jgi:putative FmdB family regulatory protein
MPVYEYVCPACHTQFEDLRLMKEADDFAPCPRCATQSLRQISHFVLKRSAAPASSSVPATGRKAHPSGCSCCAPGLW